MAASSLRQIVAPNTAAVSAGTVDVQDSGDGHFLVAFCGLPLARWSRFVESTSAHLKDYLSQLRGSADVECDHLVTGFGVVRGWRHVCGQFSIPDGHLLAAAAYDVERRRSGARFLEHLILDAVIVESDWQTRVGGLVYGAGLARRVQELVQEFSPKVLKRVSGSVEKNGQSLHLPSLFNTWCRQWRIPRGRLLLWPVCREVAYAFACGHLRCDVSIIWRRQVSNCEDMAPVDISMRRKRSFMKAVCDELPSLDDSYRAVLDVAGAGAVSAKRRCGSCSSYSFATHLATLQVSAHIKNQRELRQVCCSGMSVSSVLLQRPELTHLQERLAGADIPTGWTICRARIRFDIASMFGMRGYYRRRGPCFRYLAFDASPQRPGIEVFASAERVLTRRSVMDAFPTGAWPNDVLIRRLPLCVLGQGRASVSDKVSAHCHQVWLDYGSDMKAMRDANADVRGILSDMGVEHAVGDYADILDSIVTGPSSALTELQQRSSGYLYPYALVIPGPQHTIDNIFKTCIQSLDWWLSWVADSKVVCQWLANHSHRELLANIIRGHSDQVETKLGIGSVDRLLQSLRTTCDRFAAWRWKTIANVTRDLLRLQEVSQMAMSLLGDDVDSLGTRDAARRTTLVRAIRCEAFWTRVRALQTCVEPLSRLADWLRGCPCHEKARRKGQVVSCKWAGCRAFQFANRLRSAEDTLRYHRDHDPPAGVVHAEWRSLLTKMLALFQLKFAWVHEAPYTVWSIVDSASAAAFLRDYDDRESRGEPLHRVSFFVAGKAPWSLRRDMEELVATGIHTQRLWSELQSYRMCPLDETFIEAAHRDVTHIGKTASSSKMHYRAAGLRLRQNLDAYEHMDAQYQKDVRCAFYRSSAIVRRGQLSASPQKRPRRVRQCTLLAAASHVYRCDQSKFVHWGVFEEHMKAFVGSVPGKQRFGVSTRLRLEYLRCVIQADKYYSVPILSASSLSQLGTAKSTADALCLVDEGGVDSFLIFHVLDVAVGRKKLLVTSGDVRSMRSMVWPVQIQRLAVWRSNGNGGKYPAGEYEVFMEEDAEIVDILDLVPWPVFRLSLRRWSCSSADVSGCLLLRHSSVVTPSPSMPTVTCLETLLALGWQAGNKPPRVHTDSSPRVFRWGDAVRRKPYLQCLARLADILVLMPQGLPSTACNDTCEQLLSQLAADHAVPARLPIADVAEDNVVSDDGHKEADTQEADISLWSVSELLLSGSCRNNAGVTQGTTAASSSSVADTAGVSPPIATLVEHAESEAHTGVPVEMIEAGAEAPLGHSALRAVRDVPLPMYLGDSRVYSETHLGTLSRQQYYTRISVLCQCTAHQEPRRGRKPLECRRRRNTGPLQTSQFGELEPYAFLGAWLAVSGKFRTRAEHMRYEPAPDEVSAYMRSVGWRM